MDKGHQGQTVGNWMAEVCSLVDNRFESNHYSDLRMRLERAPEKKGAQSPFEASIWP